jgi:WD40 repeat protein
MLILSGHNKKVHTLAFAPDGRTLASVAGHDTRIWLWDLEKAQPASRVEHKRRVASVVFRPGGRAMAYADSVGSVSRWEFTSGMKQGLFRLEPLPNLPVRLAFSPDGTLLAAMGLIAVPARPSPSSRLCSSVTLFDWDAGGCSEPDLHNSGSYLTSLVFSPDGSMLAAGSLDSSVYLWNLSEDLAPTALNHGRKVHFVAYSPDGRTLASASPEGLVKVWDAHTGMKRTTLKGQGKFLHAIAYSPDGRSLATAAGDGSVRFWEVSSGRPLRGFDWGIGPVHSVAFAPDGMRAAAGGERDIVVWDLDDWG